MGSRDQPCEASGAGCQSHRLGGSPWPRFAERAHRPLMPAEAGALAGAAARWPELAEAISWPGPTWMGAPGAALDPTPHASALTPLPGPFDLKPLGCHGQGLIVYCG